MLMDEFVDVIELFRFYNITYFDASLDCVSVEWSGPRMTLCAGICTYHRREGLCQIRLSEPLLKYRPMHDMKNTLLHEMIHAWLFVKEKNTDHSAHGPCFVRKMEIINAHKAVDPYRPPQGYKITVFHTFVDEVAHYRQHHWECDRCGNTIQRAMNRAPSENDCWRFNKFGKCSDSACPVHQHMKHCGGSYIKTKEPEPKLKPKSRKRSRLDTSDQPTLPALAASSPPFGRKESKQAVATKNTGAANSIKASGHDQGRGSGGTGSSVYARGVGSHGCDAGVARSGRATGLSDGGRSGGMGRSASGHGDSGAGERERVQGRSNRREEENSNVCGNGRIGHGGGAVTDVGYRSKGEGDTSQGTDRNETREASIPAPAEESLVDMRRKAASAALARMEAAQKRIPTRGIGDQSDRPSHSRKPPNGEICGSSNFLKPAFSGLASNFSPDPSGRASPAQSLRRHLPELVSGVTAEAASVGSSVGSGSLGAVPASSFATEPSGRWGYRSDISSAGAPTPSRVASTAVSPSTHAQSPTLRVVPSSQSASISSCVSLSSVSPVVREGQRELFPVAAKHVPEHTGLAGNHFREDAMGSSWSNVAMSSSSPKLDRSFTSTTIASTETSPDRDDSFDRETESVLSFSPTQAWSQTQSQSQTVWSAVDTHCEGEDAMRLSQKYNTQLLLERLHRTSTAESILSEDSDVVLLDQAVPQQLLPPFTNNSSSSSSRATSEATKPVPSLSGMPTEPLASPSMSMNASPTSFKRPPRPLSEDLAANTSSRRSSCAPSVQHTSSAKRPRCDSFAIGDTGAKEDFGAGVVSGLNGDCLAGGGSSKDCGSKSKGMEASEVEVIDLCSSSEDEVAAP
eukprot:Rmarinus@m.17548